MYRISVCFVFVFGMAYTIFWIRIYTYLVGLIWFREGPNLEQVVNDSRQFTLPVL